jgi:hypothetical protein
MKLASAYRILSFVLIVQINFSSGKNCFLLPWFFFAVVIIARTHTTKLHRKTQIKTHPHTHTHTQRKKEERASACGFPNPNSVVELKGGRRAIFFFFLFLFLAKLRQILT